MVVAINPFEAPTVGVAQAAGARLRAVRVRRVKAGTDGVTMRLMDHSGSLC